MQTLLFASGLILFLLGLITGLAIPAVKNPRMGLASHLQGMTAAQLAAIWGAGGKFAPGAAGDHAASAAKEGAVNFLLVSLAPAMIAGSIILIVGVLR
jgi:hydroxylaminobenzene mutase